MNNDSTHLLSENGLNNGNVLVDHALRRGLAWPWLLWRRFAPRMLLDRTWVLIGMPAEWVSEPWRQVGPGGIAVRSGLVRSNNVAEEIGK